MKVFNFGADEYLVKPISTNILTVNAASLFKRQSNKLRKNELLSLNVDGITLQPKSQKCLVNNKDVKLTSFEFNLLKLLMQNEGNILSRDMIYTRLLGRVYNGIERTVDVRMSQLREKLSLEQIRKIRIETIWGQGYMLSKL